MQNMGMGRSFSELRSCRQEHTLSSSQGTEAHTPACTICICEGLPTPPKTQPSHSLKWLHTIHSKHPVPPRAPQRSLHILLQHHRNPNCSQKKGPSLSPLETGPSRTAIAASCYLHDDVEGQIQQQVTDEDSQYVGGKVSGPIHQPKDSTGREDRRDIRQLLSLGTGPSPN